MSSQSEDKRQGLVRMELKYCERCGGLWVRESGAGTAYCEKCQPKVADLPIPKKKPGKLTLPVGPRAEVEGYGVEISKDELRDLEAVGGVA